MLHLPAPIHDEAILHRAAFDAGASDERTPPRDRPRNDRDLCALEALDEVPITRERVTCRGDPPRAHDPRLPLRDRRQSSEIDA